MEQVRAGFFPQADITVGSGSETTDSPVTRAATGKHSRGLHRYEAEIFIRQLLYDGNGTVSEVVAAREQHKAAESLFYPRVHLEIGGTANDNIDGISGHNNDASIMLRGRYSFTGGKDIARRKETVFQMDEAKEIRDRTRRQVIESIQLSWNAFETANSQLEFFKIHVDASKQALLAYRKQFNIGKRTLLDVLDQENEVFQAQINYVNGLTEVDFSAYRILAGTGRLLWALGVPLPEAANTIQAKR